MSKIFANKYISVSVKFSTPLARPFVFRGNYIFFYIIFMFAPYINSIKTLFIVPTDEHYHKIIEILKQFKIIILAPTRFGSRSNHHQGAVLRLAKTTKWFFCARHCIDAVNVMAAYQPAVQAWGEPHTYTTGWYALIVCISWKNKKCLILLMHGANMSFAH